MHKVSRELQLWSQNTFIFKYWQSMSNQNEVGGVSWLDHIVSKQTDWLTRCALTGSSFVPLGIKVHYFTHGCKIRWTGGCKHRAERKMRVCSYRQRVVVVVAKPRQGDRWRRLRATVTRGVDWLAHFACKQKDTKVNFFIFFQFRLEDWYVSFPGVQYSHR